MKKIPIIVCMLLITVMSCKKDDDANQSLPEATQTGAGTFACYIDGKAFIDTSGGYFNCFYQLIDGEYYFGIGGNDEGSIPQNLYLQTEKKEIVQGVVYSLIELAEGNAYAGGGFSFSITESYQTYTSVNYTGELTITKLDFENNIVSGTFWFDIAHPVTGDTVEIREGRFDTLFTE